MSTAVDNETRLEAREILGRVLAMTEDHRLVRGSYLFEAGLETLPQAPICNGFEACAIGSLYLSAGVKPFKRNRWLEPILPGTDDTDAYVSRYGSPALKLAYATLNKYATAQMIKEKSSYAPGGVDDGTGCTSAIETYFECCFPSTEQMLDLIRRARNSLRP